MGKTWSDVAIRNLVDWRKCPVCDYSPLAEGMCLRCGADLTGSAGVTLAAASEAAVAALQARQVALEKLPIAVPATSPVYMPAGSPTVAPPRAPAPASAPTAERPSSQISVQSVLAVAGAGLVAIAAIVFTFFNRGLANPDVRNLIVAAIAIVFLGAAWLLARAKLQFSAEAVAALGMVFVVIDIWAISANLSELGTGRFLVAAGATVVMSLVMITLASLRRMRTWLWSGLVGIAIAPVLLGYSGGGEWVVALGYLGSGFAALVTHEIARALQPRFNSPLLADHGTATVVQFLVLPAVLVQLFWLQADSTLLRILGISGLLAGLALMSALATRNGARAVWSYLAGAFITVAVALLPFAHNFADDEWLLAVVPAVAAGTAAILAVVSRFGAASETPVISRVALMWGTLSVAFFTTIPATFVSLAQLITPHSIWGEWGLAALLGVAATALGSAIVGFIRSSNVLVTVSLWLGVLALSALATWAEPLDVWRVTMAVTFSAALASLVTWVRPLAGAKRRTRLPFLVGAHLLVAEAIFMPQGDELLTIFGGLGVAAAIAVLLIAMPAKTRPFYLAAGYAWSLGLFAYTLATQTVLEYSVVLGLTAMLAAAVTIAVTVLRAVPARYWYSVLAVTAIPFLISIFSTLVDRDLWIGYSTAVGFLLAALLVLAHRPGLNVFLRGLAAALLVPSLAVVVINIVAVIAEQSASPITLPIIAGLVALTLPTTGAIGHALVRLGHEEDEITAVRLALEISALVTGSIAVLLTIVRAAAGFDTTFLVLVIIGLGAAATGLFRHRAYAWYVAYISFTGALWALLALNNIDIVELFVLPPALAAAIIGAIGVDRGRRGLGFYAVGLSIAVATPLCALALRGNPTGSIEWRTYSLIAGAVLLIVVGGLLGRIGESSRFAKLSRLRVATLFVAVGAASAGSVQAVRYGWHWDASVLGTTEAVLLPVLVFSAISAVLAAFAGALIAEKHARLAASRWLYVPAMVLLVVGPMASLRHGYAYPITMLLLAVALLGLMIVTVVVARSTRTLTLPPVWVTFAVAWFTAVAGWAERDHFRVEAFSIPLGLSLLAAGIIAMRPVKDAAPSFSSWPIGFQGSWRLLTPGIIVTLLPSVLATGTDPQTWRAILVIALALIAILIGNLRKLAAPFILGIITLPVENLVVFLVQVGDKIDPAMWWITLATAGAVLLILAVTSERGSTGDRGVAARLRDLK